MEFDDWYFWWGLGLGFRKDKWGLSIILPFFALEFRCIRPNPPIFQDETPGIRPSDVDY